MLANSHTESVPSEGHCLSLKSRFCLAPALWGCTTEATVEAEEPRLGDSERLRRARRIYDSPVRNVAESEVVRRVHARRCLRHLARDATGGGDGSSVTGLRERMRSRQRPVVLPASFRISLVRNQPKHNGSARSCHRRCRCPRRRCLLRRASSDESAGSSQRDEPARQVAHLLSPFPPGTRPAARRVRDFASHA
jgi:hypothetical protein